MSRVVLVIFALFASVPALADEGMWTYDDFPVQKLAQGHGFTADSTWLKKAQLSSVRLADGCSASLVSPSGLVMTNHHCAHDCIANLSTAGHDFVKSGYYARTQAEEKMCPGMEVDRLVEISHVTDQVKKAVAGKEGKAYSDALHAVESQLEKACATSADVRCDVVKLYQGGKYDLYKYQRFQDVRLVFAPELSVAFFGGDPDNFMFPRYDLDVSFVRIYQNGKPWKPDAYFQWSPAGSQPGQLTFVSGNPGATSRLLTPAQLAFERDVYMPQTLFYLSELRGLLTEFQERSPEARREATELLFGVENSMKANKGRLAALYDPDLLPQKQKELDRVVKALHPASAVKASEALATIAAREADNRAVFRAYTFLEQRGRSRGFLSQLFGYARALVRASVEIPKPNEQRLREFADANLPAVKNKLASTAPVHTDLEIETLTFSLLKLRENLGAEHPAVKAALGTESPRQVATRVVRGSKLADPKVRMQLFAGGAKAIAASKDPMIALAQAVDPFAREVRARYEDTIEAPITAASEVLATARFEALGTSQYPDATFTPRLSWGTVAGWTRADGVRIDPYTSFAGAYSHATGQPPYDLPATWTKAKSAVDGATPLNLVTTNDIIGGNSGSPVFDEDLRIVGLIFDGNIESLGGDYYFDPKLNRAVAVDSRALTEALSHIYGAQRIVDELKGEGVTGPRAGP